MNIFVVTRLRKLYKTKAYSIVIRQTKVSVKQSKITDDLGLFGSVLLAHLLNAQ